MPALPQARGAVLLFLHADSRLPEGADTPGAAGGGAGRRLGTLRRAHRGPPALLRLVAALMNLRSRCSGIATGDQAIFVQRDRFEQVGGYPEQPLMEDIELSRRLRAPRPAALPAPARAHLGPPLGVARRVAHHPADVVAALALLARRIADRRWPQAYR